MTLRTIGQIIGFAGTALFILSFQIKENKKLFLMQLLSFAISVVHYFMIGAITGSGIMLINVLRCVVMYFYNDKSWARWKIWPVVLVAAYVANTVLTWDTWLSLLPLIGTLACTYGCWSRNPRTIRMANLLLGSPTWLVYDIVQGSVSASIMESLTIISILVSLVRYGWKSLDMKD